MATVGEFDDDHARAVRALLQRAIQSMEAELRKGRGTVFDQAMALRRKQAIERELARLEVDLTKALQRGMEGAAKISARVPVEVQGEEIEATAGVDAGAVAQAKASAAELVRNVTDDVRAALNTAVTKAVVGELDGARFEQEVRDALGADALHSRVERIVRTELSKVHAAQDAVNDARLAENPDVDLIKRWSSSGKGPLRARPEHAAIDGQERELDDQFDIGGGATAETPPGGGERRATGPHDPTLPAADVIQCGCRRVLVPRSEARQTYIAKVRPRAPEPV